jgi:small basic protein (TIGR04137 family)
MTIDKSLKVRRGATSNRSVLTRIERLEKLKEMDRWTEGDSPLGLAKVRVRKLQMKKKKKEKKEEDATTKKGAKGAKGAAPAKDAPKKKK